MLTLAMIQLPNLHQMKPINVHLLASYMAKKHTHTGHFWTRAVTYLAVAGALAFLQTALHAQVPNWFTDTNPSNLTDGAVITAKAADGERGQSFLSYFTPVELEVGDTLQLTWSARLDVFTAGTNLARFGFYDSKGKHLSGNNAYTHPDLAEYTGIGFWPTNLRADSRNNQKSSISIHYRKNLNPTLVAGTAHGGRVATAGDAHETMGINQWTPKQTIRLTRTIEGWEVLTRLGGVEGEPELQPNETRYKFPYDEMPQNRFDTVGFWYRTAATATPTVSLRDIELAFQPAP